jgi:hypothetical protein
VAGRKILARNDVAENDAGMQWVWRDVAILVARLDGAPIVEIQGGKLAAAGRRRRTAVLLRTVDPVGKLIVYGDVIKLAGGLVVPGAPGFTGVARDDGALVAAHDHALRIIWIDP